MCGQVFEVMFETTPELMFELYVIAVEYFVYANRDIAPVLVGSVVIGLFSICFGIANAYVGDENLKTRCLWIAQRGIGTLTNWACIRGMFMRTCFDIALLHDGLQAASRFVSDAMRGCTLFNACGSFG